MQTPFEKVLFSKASTYFLQLVETMNYTQAAHILGISQPALTQQIKKLEQGIGATLFSNRGKKLYLTASGKTMYSAILAVQTILVEATDRIQKDSSETSGPITVGISASVEESVFTEFITHYFLKYPNVEVTLLMMNRREILENLENNKLDIAILYLPSEAMTNMRLYQYKTIIKDEILFMHHDPALESKQSVTYREVTQHPWVTYPKTYFVAAVIENAFKKQGSEMPKSVAHFTKPEQMLRFSDKTGIYTALPRSFFEAHQSETHLRAIPFNPRINLDLAFMFRPDKLAIPRVQHFLNYFERYLAEEDYISRLKHKMKEE